MASSLHHPLEGIVHADEFMIGGPEEQKRWSKEIDSCSIRNCGSECWKGIGRGDRKCFLKRIR